MTTGPDGVGHVRTVFLGSGAFGAPSLRALVAHPRIRVVGVVTAPPRPVGRRQVLTPTPIHALADTLGLAPVLAPQRLRDPASIDAILSLEPALAVLADYGQIVPPRLLDLPHGALNLHPSLLPRWRGAIPVPATIREGDAEAGVTLMRMDAGLDTGDILAQERFPLLGRETGPELEAALSEAAGALLSRALDAWLDGAIQPIPQAATGREPTLTRPLRREDGRLDPQAPAASLERLVRAYLPWPGTFVELGGERLIVTEAHTAPRRDGDAQGAIVAEGRQPALVAADGRLVLDSVTPPGRKPMPGADWLRGRRPA